MKDVAGAHAAATEFLLSEIIQKPNDDVNPEYYMQIEESADTQAQSRHVLPLVLLKKSEVMNTRARGFQDKTKRMVYTLLLLSTVSTIGFKWLNNFS